MEDGAYRFADFSLRPSQRSLFQGKKLLRLQPKAFDVLLMLVRNHGGLISRDTITETLWPDTYVTEANLTNIIVQLRKLLGREAVVTVSKYGYRFMLPVSGEPGLKQTTYATFVRGKELLQERSLNSISTARDLFMVCVADDPQYAAGWAWLARTSRLLDKFKGEPVNGPSLPEAAFKRAFAIDPDLACAHQFYTQLQVDSGHARLAMTRLGARLKRCGEDPETLAGLVQVFRCCGLLDLSIAAHHRAIELDPTVRTSVAHSYFLRGDYERVFETYAGTPFYLDAAAWAGLGKNEHAISLIGPRLERPNLGPFMSSMMLSLVAAIEEKADVVIASLGQMQNYPEPEALYYYARHCGLVGSADSAVRMIRRARLEGFTCAYGLKHDAAFNSIRRDPGFLKELEESIKIEKEICREFKTALGDLSGFEGPSA